MDWVVNGQKYNVEFNFGLIDIDSIMGRIENSKESLRNSAIPDLNGSGEVHGVNLIPNEWATYCKRKAGGWYERNGSYTLAQLDNEIARLESLSESYTSAETLVKKEPTEYPVTDATAPTVDLKALKDTVADKLSGLYKAQAALSGAKYNLEQLQGTKDPEEAKVKEAQAKVEGIQTAVAEAQKALKDAEKAEENAVRSLNEFKKMVLDGPALDDTKKWFGTRLATIHKELEKLKTLRADKAQKNPVEVPVISGATAPEDPKAKDPPKGTDLATTGSVLANPIFKSPAPPGGASADDADPWTTITFSYSASDVSTHSHESAWGMKVGGSVGFGLWSAGGSYAHDEAHKSMQSDMAACDFILSFSALVVNINRPWLYGELFSDGELEGADGVQLSPGPLRLHKMLQEQNLEAIDEWSQFPAYPTSFIVAADTTIEFRGVTKHIEEHFDSHSNAGGVSLGYGPWSVSSSFHESATEQSMQVHSTATGCKISFGAPQIIAWVSQILPPLPRDHKFNPLTQGGGIPVKPVWL